jgi:hypothetical protein
MRALNCSFPVAGAYQVSILVDDELIAQRRFVLLQGG